MTIKEVVQSLNDLENDIILIELITEDLQGYTSKYNIQRVRELLNLMLIGLKEKKRDIEDYNIQDKNFKGDR